MTVGELIEALQAYDPNTEVVLYETYDDLNLTEVYPFNGKVVLTAW